MLVYQRVWIIIWDNNGIIMVTMNINDMNIMGYE